MANALDYIDWRGDLSFAAAPVNEIDQYIFSVLGCPDFTGIVPEDDSRILMTEALDRYFARNPDIAGLGLVASQQVLPMLRKIRTAPRYGQISLSGFRNIIDEAHTEQFSACTVHVEGVHYITFRGTDDTIVGWKENCELASKECVPAQRDALDYLNWAAGRCEGPLIVCGHSKGGNLAIYASILPTYEVQDRILQVLNYDGPGFMPEFIRRQETNPVVERIINYVPYRSIVGMLLNRIGPQVVVSSEVDGIHGHDGLNWHVERDHFIRMPELSISSRVFNESIDEALFSLPAGDREELVEEVLELLSSTGAFLLTDFTEQTLRQSWELAKHLRKSTEIRNFIQSLVQKTIKYTGATIKEKVSDRIGWEQT